MLASDVMRNDEFDPDEDLNCRTLKPVDTAAALARGSTPRPAVSQPWASALPLLLGSGPNPFEASRQPSSGRPKAEHMHRNPLTGTETIQTASHG